MQLSIPQPTRGLRPTNYFRAFEQMKQSEILSTKEEAFFDALREVDISSLWGEAILAMFIDYTVLRFRELVCELLSQNDDCPDTMYRILGQPAYDLLIALKPM